MAQTQGERIRILRKALGLTLEKFGERIGMKKSSVSQIETGTNSLTEKNAKMICAEFGVSEEWLINGFGSMFKESAEFNFDDYIKMKDASDLELEILKAYFDLDPEIRRTVINHFMDRLKPKVYYDQEADPYNLVEIVNSNRKEVEELLEKNNRNVVGE